MTVMGATLTVLHELFTFPSSSLFLPFLIYYCFGDSIFSFNFEIFQIYVFPSQENTFHINSKQCIVVGLFYFICIVWKVGEFLN